MTCGKRISELRIKNGLTQDELSKKIGITRAALSHYEKDRREPDFDTLQKLANFFEVSIDHLLGRDHSKEVTNIPEWATSKDKRDFKKMLDNMLEQEGMFYGDVPMDEDDREKVKRVVEALFWDAKKRNKRKKTDKE